MTITVLKLKATRNAGRTGTPEGLAGKNTNSFPEPAPSTAEFLEERSKQMGFCEDVCKSLDDVQDRLPDRVLWFFVASNTVRYAVAALLLAASRGLLEVLALGCLWEIAANKIAIAIGFDPEPTHWTMNAIAVPFWPMSSIGSIVFSWFELRRRRSKRARMVENQ